ncbi:MAG TPA: amidohydrolase family protein [Planctomicrobium sp.]|nr:amidohydrolase family protein [Planctomicrobium sp.]
MKPIFQTLSDRALSHKTLSHITVTRFPMLVVALLMTLFVLSPVVADDQVVVLRGARLIDGTGSPPQEDAEITIHGEKITQVTASESATLPKGAQIIDLRGKTIIPGVISAHSHVGQFDGIRRGTEHFTRENIVRQLRQYEAYGVTTVVSLGTNLPLIYDLQKEARDGKLPGADLFGADRGIGVIGGAPGQLLLNNADQIDRPQTVKEARDAVRAAKARGTDFIKIWVDPRGMNPKMSKEIYTAVIDEAHQVGLRVAAHLFTLEDAKRLVAAGVDVIAHGVRDQPVDDEFIQAMKEKSVWYVATLALDDATFIYADRPDWMQTPFFRHSVQPELQKQFDDPEWQKKTLASPSAKTAREWVRMNQRNLAILHDAGVKIGFGTDSGAFPIRIAGFAEHRELELMAEAGLPLLSVIAIATGNNAELLHLKDQGTIAPGKLADLVVLDADPSTEVTNVHQIHSVWHRGKKVSGPVTEFTP